MCSVRAEKFAPKACGLNYCTALREPCSSPWLLRRPQIAMTPGHLLFPTGPCWSQTVALPEVSDSEDHYSTIREVTFPQGRIKDSFMEKAGEFGEG